MAKTTDYIDRATERIVELLDEHHALAKMELIARISEGSFAESGKNIDPHHVGTALSGLRKIGYIATAKAETRGGREVGVLVPANTRGRATKVAQAAQRKRLLYARYLGWAQGSTKYPQGRIGPAGESAVRKAILAAETIRPASPGAGPVRTILNTDLHGAADSGGFYLPIVDGIPQDAVTVLIEVKNIREQIYPSNGELYQILRKALILQQANPGRPVLGILVCRKAHWTLYPMARQLGFVVIELGVQFAGAVDEVKLDEVRNELAFRDLRVGSGPSRRVQDRLSTSQNLVAKLPELADAWAQTAANGAIADLIAGTAGMKSRQVRAATDELRVLAADAGYSGGW